MKPKLYRYRYLALLVGAIYLLSLAYFGRVDINLINGGDNWGYYGYLPAAFIHGDLADIDSSYLKQFQYSNRSAVFPSPGGELPIAENGHRVIKYTAGVALMQLPFFTIGHVWASIDSRYAADGYSFPYRLLIHLANLFYLLIGGRLLFRILADETNRKTAFWVLLILALGTNLYNFAIYRGPMSHSYLFALYGILMYASWQFYRSPAWRWALLIGLSAGFITLIRPVEILCLAIPLTYGLAKQSDWSQRLSVWSAHWQKLAVAAAVFILCGIPQLLYWKYASGHWRFDSYPGEAFDFTRAKIFGGLFSYQNGMFVYSPILILALIGLIWLVRRRNWLWPMILILPLHIFIAYSWWCWYYINGFGSRPMVEVYALLAVPLAYTVQWLTATKGRQILLAGLTIAAIALQLFQNWQHGKGVLIPEFANKAYYWSVFGKTDMSYDALVAFDSEERQPDSMRLERLGQWYQSGFETADSTLLVDTNIVFEGRQSARLEPDKKYLEWLHRPVGELKANAGDWVRVSAWCYKQQKEFPWYTAPALVVTVEDGSGTKKYRQVRIDSKLSNPGYSIWGGQPNTWGYVRLWYRLPDDLVPDDRIKVFAMAENQAVFLDQVTIEHWR